MHFSSGKKKKKKKIVSAVLTEVVVLLMKTGVGYTLEGFPTVCSSDDYSNEVMHVCLFARSLMPVIKEWGGFQGCHCLVKT